MFFFHTATGLPIEVSVSCWASIVKGNWIKSIIHIQSEQLCLVKNENEQPTNTFSGHISMHVQIDALATCSSMWPVSVRLCRKIANEPIQSREFKPECFVCIITFFRLSMTKCLVVIWRQYAINVHQLCVRISFSLCLHISKATGVAWYVQDAGAWWGQGKEPRMTRSSGNNFGEELDLFVSVSRDMWR